jgi:formylmethanofuran dehydrogenase subunit B
MQSLEQLINVTCPACGLMCDDIAINASNGETNTNCNKAVSFFKNALSNQMATPSVKGKPVMLDEAIQKTACLIKNSQHPLFAGLGTEVKGMRAIVDLAKTANATLDHMHSEGTVNNTLTLQNIGYQTTTMTEVKNRADVVLVIGTTLDETHPRFFEKLVWNKDSLFDKPTPEVIYLGIPKTSVEKITTASPDGKLPEAIHAEIGDLPAIMNVLNALLNAKSPIHKQADTTQIANIKLATLNNLIQKLKNAQYGVVVWSTSSLKAIPHSELTIQSIVTFINKLNETNRVAGLPLNSGDGDTTVNNTNTWITGYPTRMRFINGNPSFDARALSTNKQLSQCDSLLWISTFNAISPPRCSAPTIVIGHPNTILESPPDVFIPVGVPSVHQNGTMFRMDSSVTLPLKKVAESNLPTLASVLQKIESLLA